MSRFKAEDAFDIAQRFVGVKEIGGEVDNPMILSMLKLDNDWPQNDEVPWCSAFVNYVCWLLRLPRSKDLRARSWLTVGTLETLETVQRGDIIVLQRGTGEQPGPEVINAPGHVGFYAGHDDTHVEVLGGNQSDTVKISRYPIERLLAVRSLE